MMHGEPTRILVIGGGITGLAAAHRLTELAASRSIPLDVTLLEASSRVGGVIETQRIDDYLVELGPDNFITNKTAAIDLCKRLGLEGELLRTNDEHRRAMVVRKGRLVPIPEGFELMAPRNLWAMARSPIFSLAGKFRMWREQFIKARATSDGDDESLSSFVIRRFGREALDRLVQPLISGIYVADPDTLSVRATVPRFLDMEASHGSIIRAMKAQKRAKTTAGVEQDAGARYSLFVTLRQGMSVLTQTLAAKLGDRVKLNTRVTGLSRLLADSPRWRVSLADGSTMDADSVILAVPSYVAADWLRPTDESLAAQLDAIEYASSAIIVLAYRAEQVKHPTNAFGFVVPAIEKRRLIAGSFVHRKYVGRAPEGHVLLRAFVGGALQPEMTNKSDDELTAIAREEFTALLGITGEPLFTRVQRWPRSMPQYKVGHLARVAQLRQHLTQHPGLELAGNAFEGVGIPDCIANGQAAAERVIE
ncbi:MAG: protoporphyrinogen oxidase [Phycisphaeraceae bacterium]